MDGSLIAEPPPAGFFFEIAANRAGDGVLATTPDIDDPLGPSIVYCNQGFEKHTGWNRKEVLGKTPRILQCAETQRSELDRIRSAMVLWREHGFERDVSVRLANQTRWGDPVWFDITLFPAWAPNRAASYWVAALHDVTRDVQIEQEIHSALRTEQAARCAKLDLLEKLSFEMRAQLSDIMGFSELLSSEAAGGLTEAQHDFAAHIQMSGKELLKMLAEIRDFTLYRRQELEAVLERVDLVEAVRLAIDDVAPLARRHDVRINVDLPDAVWVVADPTRARQCAAILIENAIRATPRGGIIRIRSTESAARKAITVFDEGETLAGSALASMERTIARIDSDDWRPLLDYGRGVAMPLAAQLMRAQGGLLHVSAEDEKGSAFSLVFQCG